MFLLRSCTVIFFEVLERLIRRKSVDELTWNNHVSPDPQVTRRPGEIRWDPTLEDIQHQVQSNCLELSISSSYPNDHASTASLSFGTGQIRPFWPRQPGRAIGLAFRRALARKADFAALGEMVI
jgi:hypothetical protein